MYISNLWNQSLIASAQLLNDRPLHQIPSNLIFPFHHLAINREKRLYLYAFVLKKLVYLFRRQFVVGLAVRADQNRVGRVTEVR